MKTEFDGGNYMAISVEKLKGGYEFFSTMDGYCLCFPNGNHKWFATYSSLEKYAKKHNIDLGE